jgi:hypothetical protein
VTTGVFVSFAFRMGWGGTHTTLIVPSQELDAKVSLETRFQ